MDIIKNFKRNKTAFLGSIWRRLAWAIPNDAFYLRVLYLFEMHRFLDLKNPKTFNEKIQWLKLHNRNPEYTTMVDKLAVKDYVANLIGSDYIIPTLGVWKTFDEIDFDKLPSQFVLKTTHGGGGMAVVICRDKRTFNRDKARRILEKSLKSDIYQQYREWPYKNVPKRIIAEKFMTSQASNASKDLPDYKFFCFDGEPMYCQVIRDRHSLETIDFYDMEWNHQEFVGLNVLAQNGEKPVECPRQLATMQEICRKLSKGIPFVRVDLYVIDDIEYFGELTFYPASGFGSFTPKDWNNKFGELLKVPTIQMGGVKIIVKNNNFQIQRNSDKQADLRDYKFFCFNGIVRLFKIDYDRFTNHHANYYSREGELLPFGEDSYKPTDKQVLLPLHLNKMIELAETLAKDKFFVRVDFYDVNNKIYFGEITFYPASGLGKFTDEKWDLKLGDWLELS